MEITVCNREFVFRVPNKRKNVFLPILVFKQTITFYATLILYEWGLSLFILPLKWPLNKSAGWFSKLEPKIAHLTKNYSMTRSNRCSPVALQLRAPPK